MLLKDLFEAVSDTSKSSLISSVQGYQSAMRSMIQTLRDRADEIKIARRMVGGQKARWVNENYLSSRRFKNSGLQSLAAHFAKNAKSDKARQLFQRLATIKFSAMKESGKAQIFDQIGTILSALGSITKDPELTDVFQSLKDDRKAFDAAFEGRGPTRRTPAQPKQPKREDLSGAQNQQAEAVFQEILKSLPKAIQTIVRRDTSRMGPAEKLAYLRSM
jgi:hypothetical protein